MYHLRLPHHPFSEYPATKLLCGVSSPKNGSTSVFDLADFSYSKATLLGQASELPPLDAAAPFLQASLWFRLLPEVFSVVGVTIDYHDFIVGDKIHGYRLSTHALHLESLVLGGSGVSCKRLQETWAYQRDQQASRSSFRGSSMLRSQSFLLRYNSPTNRRLDNFLSIPRR